MKLSHGLALAGISLETLFLVMRALGATEARVAESILLQLLTHSVYLVSVFLILRTPAEQPSSRQYTAILAASFLFRLTLWPMPPSFSDDVYRYRWEGKLQSHGGNPYQVRPNDEEWERIRDETFARVGQKDFKAAYGPVQELIQHATYRALNAVVPDPFAQAFWFKLPSALFDIGVVFALAALLRARSLPVERVLIYSWSPLPVFEFWGNGHNDALAVLLVVLALLAAAKNSWSWSFLWLSLGVAAKFWPVLLFPAFLTRCPSRRWLRATVLLPVMAFLCAPYWSNVQENARFLSGFVGGWRNNDSLYGVLLWITADAGSAKRLAFLLIAVAALGAAWRSLPLEQSALAAIVSVLLLSANCHPWYLTWFLPLLAFMPSPALFLWAALMPLSYDVLFRWMALGDWDGSTPMRWWIYSPALAFLAPRFLAKFMHRRRDNARGAETLSEPRA